jgi:hypothetical protein
VLKIGCKYRQLLVGHGAQRMSRVGMAIDSGCQGFRTSVQVCDPLLANCLIVVIHHIGEHLEVVLLECNVRVIIHNVQLGLAYFNNSYIVTHNYMI